MTRGADVHAMRATVGYQVIACDGEDVPVLTGEPSRATLLSTLVRPGAGRIWRAATRRIAAAIALLTALSLLLERSWRVAAILIAFCARVTATDALAQNVVAHVDGVFYEGVQPFVLGWACQPGSPDSLGIKISADAPNGQFLVAGRADFESDPGVGNACRDREGKHRFKLPLPSSMFVKGRERKVYVEALPPKGAPPTLSGTYRHALTHPLVFTTPRSCENSPSEAARQAAIQRRGSVNSQNRSRATFGRATTGARSIPAATPGFFNMRFPMSRKMVRWRKRFALH